MERTEEWGRQKWRVKRREEDKNKRWFRFIDRLAFSMIPLLAFYRVVDRRML